MWLRRKLQRLTGHTMKISARNQLPGTINAVNPGAIDSEVVIDIGGATVVAVIINDSVKRLGLAAGKKA